MLRIENVSFSYPDSEENGIYNINLQIKAGECVLLCGPSGCGKTTLTRLINGLIPHFYNGTLQGSVQVAGLDVTRVPLYVISQTVGSVFQNPRSQFFNVDTDSEIVFGLENMAYPVDAILRRKEATVRDLELETLLGRSMFSLSGGEKQRIAFASAYAITPDVFVLDEPSSNLDVQSIAALGDLLKHLKRQGKTIVIAEHRLYYLKAIADRIIYMEKGRIKHEYSVAGLLDMNTEQRRDKGLRAMDLTSITLSPQKTGSGKPALAICDISVSCGNVTLTERFWFSAFLGDIIGIVGSNGAGKSTFCRILCGLQTEKSGCFLWKNSPIGPKQRLKLSYMVMQDVNYQLFAESVLEECCLGTDNPDISRVETVLHKLSLYECRDRHPTSLSGGEKQRTAIAVSQFCHKEIFVFDEPSSGLDFNGMMQVTGLIKGLAAEGKVIFVVTHDAELLANACNRILRFENGVAEECCPEITQTAEQLLRGDRFV